MVDWQIIIALFGFCFVSSITPGPNNLMLMASGANFGLRRTVPHLLGVTIGFTLMVVLLGLGLGQIFIAVPLLHNGLKVVSVIYLTYLAWKIATSGTRVNFETGRQSKPMTFFQAVAFQWINPKAWAMGLTAVSAYTPSADPTMSLAITALLFGTINPPCIWLWAVLGTQLSRFLGTPARLRAFNWSAALLLIATLYPILTHI